MQTVAYFIDHDLDFRTLLFLLNKAAPASEMGELVYINANEIYTIWVFINGDEHFAPCYSLSSIMEIIFHCSPAQFKSFPLLFPLQGSCCGEPTLFLVMFKIHYFAYRHFVRAYAWR